MTDRKGAIKREQSQACLSYAERKHLRRGLQRLTKNFLPAGLAIFRAQHKRRASREQSQACLVSAEAQPTLSKKLKKNFEATCIALQGNGLHYLCDGKSTSDTDNNTLKS